MPMTPEQIEEMLANQQKALEQLTKSQESLATNLQSSLKATQEATAQTLQRAISDMSETLSKASTASNQPPPQELSEEDLESMSRKDFMGLIVKNLGSVMDEKLGKVSEEVQNTRSESVRERVRRQVEEMREKHKDFDDWREEMQIMAKKNPTLTAKELYVLARNEDPDKAKELDEKYKPKEEGDKGKDGERPSKSGFGGFRPGSGSGEEEPSGDMDKEESFDKAWESVFGDVTDLSGVV